MVEIGSSEMPEPEQDRLFVWDLPLRLFHWGLAAGRGDQCRDGEYRAHGSS